MSEEKRDTVHNAGSNIDQEVEAELAQALGEGQSVEEMMQQASASPEADQPQRQKAQRGQDEQAFEATMVRGRISAVEGDDVFVTLAGVEGRNQGVVPLAQFERPPRVGSIMDFVLERVDEREGVAHLSREGAISAATWDHLQTGSAVEARVTGFNKGGLELEMVGGIKGFMPASQVDIGHVDDLEQLVGQKLVARVQEINRKGRKVLLSRRAHLEHEREGKKRKLWEEIEPGQVREGKVSSLMPYGAFVDLGGADGLLHVSDMSYGRVEDPKEVVQVGQDVTVKVLKVDREKERISLGLKQVQPDPWKGISQRIAAGEPVTGRVTRVADFGVFVEVEPGVEGLVPQSELSWRRQDRPDKLAKAGDMLHLQVLQVDEERKRISLSLKQAQGDPWVGAERKFAKDSVVEATVRSITDFGAFVELERGVEGLVHISELSPKRINRVEDVLQVGQTEQFRVLEVDEEQRRIRLSLKAVAEPQAAEAAPASKAAERKPQQRLSRKPGRPLKGGLE